MSGLHLALDVDCRYCYIILQAAVLPHTSNLRSLVKKASVIKRKMSTKSKISVKMSNDGCGHNKDSGKIFRSPLTLSILERNRLCLWRRRKLSTMRILQVITTCPIHCNVLTKCITVLHAAARWRPQEVPPPVALTEASRQPPRRGQQLRAGDGGQVQPPSMSNANV